MRVCILVAAALALACSPPQPPRAAAAGYAPVTREGAARAEAPEKGSDRFDPDVPAAAFLPRALPEEVGLDAARVQALIDEAAKSGSSSLLLVKDGRVVVERYFGQPHGAIETMSVTKSIVSLAIGLLVADHRIDSVDQPLSTWLPEWAEGPKSRVTLRHVLTQTTGLDHQQAAGRLAREHDQVAYARALPLALEPGAKFSYNNEATELLSAVVAAAAGEPLDSFVRRRLLGPLGVTDAPWEKDDAGAPMAYTGLALGARDLANLGRMLANDGRWNDRAVVPAAWIREATTPSAANDAYGLLWWLRRGEGDRPLGFYADGWLGQVLAVYPAWRLVAVRQHRAIEFTEEENEAYGFRRFLSLTEATVLRP
jgi:CubicO group peptidase (beta-lactamase class C family)